MAGEKQRPTLETERLILRPFAVADAANVQRLAGDPAVFATSLGIPHPYEDGVAEEWIATHQEAFQSGKNVTFAVVLRSDNALIGAISLRVNEAHERAELGYWVGKPWWNRGYCTEAARAVLRYGFEGLGLNRICGHHFKRNPASGRVLQKIGMSYEGCLPRHVKKGEGFEDLECYGILRSDFVA